MTTTPAIMTTNATGVTNGLISPAAQSQAGAGGLTGFMNLLMQNTVQNVVQNAGQNPLGQMGQNVQAGGELAEKIAALLQQNGGKIDLSLLQQLMPDDQAAALLQKINAQQAADASFIPTLLGGAAVPGLNSDLTNQAAQATQEAAPEAMADAADPLLQDLAAQLNALEPGAPLPADAAAAEAVDAGAITTGEIMADDAMAATVLTMLSQENATPADKHVSPLAPPAASRTDAQRTPTAGDMNPQNTGIAPQTASGEPVDGSARGISAKADAAAKSAPIVVNTPAAASLTAQAAQAQNAPAPAPNGMFTGMLGTSLGALNSLLGGGFADGGFSDQGFGEQGQWQGSTGYDGAGDALQAAGTGGTGSTANTSFTNYISAAARATAPTAQMIGLQMSRNAAAKIDTFTMQLDPADLGRLEVQMNFGRDGTVSAKLIADKPETLTMLQRDSAQLERILQQSGLEVADGALSFDLREQNQQSLYEGARDGQDNPYAGRGDRAHQADATLTAQVAIEAAGYISQSGVNITV
jgi:hypothetical protein